MNERLASHRASLALGAASLASAVFYLIRSGDLALVRIASPAALAAALALGLLAVLGGWLWFGRVLTVAAGAGFAVAAVVQLVQLGRDPNWFGGDGSTFSLWLGLAVGLLAVGLAPRHRDPSVER